MSTAEILEKISMGSFVLCVLFVVLAIFFWVRYDILTVFGDLSGRTAKKSIQKMRALNEKSGNSKVYKVSNLNEERGKLTDEFNHANKNQANAQQPNSYHQAAYNDPNQQPETGILGDNQSYDEFESETEMLDDNQRFGEGYDPDATIPLSMVEIQEVPVAPFSRIQLTLLEEVILVTTDEVIE